MKIILVIILLLTSFNVFSQNVSKKKSKRLNDFGISINRLNLNEEKISNDLKLILKKERKRKVNKTVGIVLSSLSAISLTSGIVVISKSNGEPISEIVGGLMTGGGVLYGGISIPFFASANKRKKERNKLIELYNIDFNK